MGNTLCKTDACCAEELKVDKSSALTIADERKYLPAQRLNALVAQKPRIELDKASELTAKFSIWMSIFR